MAKKFKSMLSGMLALVMLSTVALPVLADTLWQGDDAKLTFAQGEDPYILALFYIGQKAYRVATAAYPLVSASV